MIKWLRLTTSCSTPEWPIYRERIMILMLYLSRTTIISMLRVIRIME